jgi:hypothetical protein
MKAPTPASEARRTSTTAEIAGDVAPPFVPLLLLLDEVGNRELVEEEFLGGRDVDELLEMDEETLGELVVGPPSLELVRVCGGMVVTPPRLHMGSPAESRKHVNPSRQQKSSPSHKT